MMLHNNLHPEESGTRLFSLNSDLAQMDLPDLSSSIKTMPSMGIEACVQPVLPLSRESATLPKNLFETALAGVTHDTEHQHLVTNRSVEDDVDALTGLAMERAVDSTQISPLDAASARAERGVSSLLGGEFGSWNSAEKGKTALERIVDTGSQHIRLAVRLDQFWSAGRPTPARIDKHVLATHEYGLKPFLLIDYDDATIGSIEDFNWFAIGRNFANRFQPNSSWLKARGIQNWGIEVYSVFNEPDIRSRWNKKDNGIGFDYQLYHDSMKAFAAGVHAVNADLKVIPGGFSSHRESGDWTARGYGKAIAPLLNDGTLDGLNLHNYNSLGKEEWTAQEQFRRHKEAMGVTADVNYYVDEFNNSREGKSGRAFLTSIWDQLGVVGNAGNGTAGKTQFALPFTLNALESRQGFGLVESNGHSDRVEVWKRLTALTQGMEFTHYAPDFFGTYELRGNDKKMWVWQNREHYTGFPGKSVVLHGVPTDATKIEIHNYKGRLRTVMLERGQTSISLNNLPENQTLMFVANGTKVTTSGGVFGPLKIDFNPGNRNSLSNGFQNAKVQKYTPWQGYGWQTTNHLDLVGRTAKTQIYRGLVRSQQRGEFKLSVPSGRYRVTMHLGDARYARDRVQVMAENNVALKNTDTAAGEIKAKSFEVLVTDGILNIQLLDQGGDTSTWSLNALEVIPLIEPKRSLQRAGQIR